MEKTIPCYCGVQKNYEQCCALYLDHQLLPSTPEVLMRSRYTAFVLGRIEYLANSMKEEALTLFDFNGLEDWLKIITWEKLTIIKTKIVSPMRGYVTFRANYWENNVAKCICEKSEFKKIQGKWYYVKGTHLNPHAKIEKI